MTSTSVKRTRQNQPITRAERTRFLEVLRQTFNVTRSAEAIGRTRAGLYMLRARDKEFKVAWEQVIEECLDNLEQVVYKEAQTGKTPLYTIFALKNRRPEVWGDKLKVEAENHSEIIVNLIPIAELPQERDSIEAEAVEVLPEGEVDDE